MADNTLVGYRDHPGYGAFQKFANMTQIDVNQRIWKRHREYQDSNLYDEARRGRYRITKRNDAPIFSLGKVSYDEDIYDEERLMAHHGYSRKHGGKLTLDQVLASDLGIEEITEPGGPRTFRFPHVYAEHDKNWPSRVTYQEILM